MRRYLVSASAAVIAAVVVTTAGTPARADDDSIPRLTTAWHDGSLQVDTGGLVSRSDVVLAGPSWTAQRSMPLGNGRLGAGVWAEDGFTAQLNRTDLFPDLKSPGQLVVPGLDSLMRASDYRGRLALHDGELVQSGGGMTARSYVHADRDLFVLEVTGADPDKVQTAELRLWSGRTPTTFAKGSIAALAETFTDGPSGKSSGAVAAVTAAARDVSAEIVDPLTVRVTFRPRDDGSFRVVTGVPAFKGGDVGASAASALAGSIDTSAGALVAQHHAWWHNFWQEVAPMKITSEDGSGEYMENLRALRLYTEAASMRDRFPASHGAVIGAFSSFKDHFGWSPQHFWHYNMRMQVSANFAANTASLNAPYFRLYLDNLQTMRSWTAEHWPGSEGICVPETIRFDGTGVYPRQTQCDRDTPPNYVVRILSSGPEVAMNMWRQYQFTQDQAFLDEAYPFMADVVRFHLSILQEGGDGYLHLEHVNSLETQRDVMDPATDLAAMKVLFPIVADLAEEHGDSQLADRLRAAIPKIPLFRQVDRNGENLIAPSATNESIKNGQDPEMEPVWPWGLFGDDGGAATELARATFRQRPGKLTNDWAMDATWAARLGLPDEVSSLLVQGTKSFQLFPNGFASVFKGRNWQTETDYYNEWNGVVATSLQEALVQSYDGLIRVPAAWPKEWDVDGSVIVEGGHRISVQVHDGTPNLVGIEAARTETLKVRNPWPGQDVRVVDGARGRGEPVVSPTDDEEISIPVHVGESYLLERAEYPYPSFAFERITGEPAETVKALGTRTIGVLPNAAPVPCVAPNGDGPLVEWDPNAGDIITDASEYHRDAAVINGGKYIDGPDGPALELSNGRYVQAEEITQFGPLDSATFYAQVRIDGSGGYRRLWDYIPPGGDGTTGFLVDVNPSNKIRFIGGGNVLQTPVAIPTGKFTKVAMMVDRDGTVVVYLDGERAWSGDLPAHLINGCGNMRVQFGADQNGGSKLVGAVDDMRIWPRALSAAEISQL